MSWPTVALSDCARVVGGATPKSAVPEYWDGDILWATPKDLTYLDSKYISDTPRKITDLGLKKSAAEILPAGSVLFSSRAPIGHIAINNVPMATNQGFKSIVPGPDLDAVFLYWWLDAHRPQLQNLGNGATFKEVSKRVVEQVQIPLPPLDEQKRIAAILNEADALRRLRQRAIDRLNALGQAVFYEMFGECNGSADLVRLGEVAKIRSSSVDPRHGQYSHLPHVSPEHIKRGSGHIAWDDVHTVSEDGVISGKYLFDENCVLYTKIRPYLNKVALPDRDGLCSADMYAIDANEEHTHRVFLKYLLMQQRFLKYAASCSGRANIPKINRKQLNHYQFSLPPLSQQIQFADRIGHLSKVLNNGIASEKGMIRLFSGLQYRAFLGEL